MKHSTNSDDALIEAFKVHQAGRLAEAKILYEGVIRDAPDHGKAHHLMGMLAVQTGEMATAIDYLRRAAALSPEDAEIAENLGGILKAEGRFEEAARCLRMLLDKAPERTYPRRMLAEVMEKQGDLGTAEAEFRRVLALDATDAAAMAGLGSALRGRGDFADAEVQFRRALAADPGLVGAMVNLALMIMRRGHTDEALALVEKALSLAPGDSRSWLHLGTVMLHQNRIEAARQVFLKSIAIDPGDAEAHASLGLALLLAGNLPEGFAEYEWRRRIKTVMAEDHPHPLWDGSPLAGATILLHTEQGHGDTIQFMRYAPLVAARGGRVVVKCHESIAALLAGARGVERVVTETPPAKEFDLHAPVMSLPRIFATSLENVPADIPYFHADPQKTRQWARYFGDGAEMRVGLVWRGNPNHPDDLNRSCPARYLRPLLQQPGVRFFGLQKDPHEDDSALPASVVNVGAEFADFTDTAACMSCLDLVIGVDTSVIHLAGALGRPVWVLVQSNPDWRWMLEREDSPWYPTMRLFRQRRWGDWDGVINRVAGALRQHAAETVC